MNEERYNIIFRGKLMSDQYLENVKNKFVDLYKGDVNKAEKCFVGKSVIIKSNVDYETAIKYQKALSARTGAEFDIEMIERDISHSHTTQEPMQSDTSSSPISSTNLLYNIVFYGEYSVKNDLSFVMKNLADFFRISIEQAQKMLTNTRKVIKENISYFEAKEYKEVFERSGVICRIEVAEQFSSEASDFILKNKWRIVTRDKNFQPFKEQVKITADDGKSKETAKISAIVRVAELEENAIVIQNQEVNPLAAALIKRRNVKNDGTPHIMKTFECPSCKKVYVVDVRGGNIVYRCVKCNKQIFAMIQL